MAQKLMAKLSELLDPNCLCTFIQSDLGTEVHEKITIAVTNYMLMLEEIQYMEQNLPGLLDDLETIKEQVDKRHKHSNVATIGGCVSSLAGGAMIVGGIIAAPFTFGATIGLTAAGTVALAAGGVTTATAKTATFAFGKFDHRKTNKMVNEFLDHYKAAEAAYRVVNQIIGELTDMLPDCDKTDGIGIKAVINGITSAFAYVVNSVRIPVTAVSTVFKGATLYQAVVSPAELHAATKLASCPTKAVPLTRQFLKGAVNTVQCAARLDGELRLAVMTSLQAGSIVLKSVGAFTAIFGIIIDAYSLVSTGYDMYKDKKCKVSRSISSHIQNLCALRCNLEVLNEHLNKDINLVPELDAI